MKFFVCLLLLVPTLLSAEEEVLNDPNSTSAVANDSAIARIATSELPPLSPDLDRALTEWLLHLKEMPAKKPESFWSKAGPTIAGTVIGAFIPGLFGFLVLRSNQKHQRESDKIARKSAVDLENIRNKFEKERQELSASAEKLLAERKEELNICSKMQDAYYEALRNYHAPLHALFEQSRGVADKIARHVHQLSRDNSWPSKQNPDKSIYRMLTVEAAKTTPAPDLGNEYENQDVTDEMRLFVWQKDDLAWVKFRMLDYMKWLRSIPELDALVSQIVENGKGKVDIISKYSGLGAATGTLPEGLGEYLSHFAILKAAYDKPRADPYKPESQLSGYYPRGLDLQIKCEYEKVKRQVQRYDEVAQQFLNRGNSQNSS